MNEEVYRKLLWALTTSYNPAAASIDRKHAFETLENFKQRADCRDYAIFILTNKIAEHNDTVRYFALQCLEKVIQRDSGNFESEEFESFRNAILEIFRHGTRGILLEAPFIKEKVAALACILGEKGYPAKWPDFIKDIIAAMKTGGAQAELGLMTLTGLMEDCEDSDFQCRLDQKCRKRLLEGLNSTLPELLSELFDLMSQYFSRLVELQDKVSESDLALHVIMLNRAMSFLQKLMAWKSIDNLDMPEKDFVSVFLVLMTEKHTLLEGMKCMVEVCNKKDMSRQLFVRLLDILPPVCTKAIQCVETDRAFSGTREGSLFHELQVQMDVVTCLSSLLNNNMITLLAGTHGTEFRTEVLNEGSELNLKLAACFDLLLRVLQLPSYRTLKIALPLLTSWFKESQICKLSFMRKSIPNLNEILLTKMTKPEWDYEELCFVRDPVASEEFDDFDSMDADLNGTRHRAIALFQSLSEFFPVEITALLLSTLTNLLDTFGALSVMENIPSDYGDRHEDGQLTRQSLAFRNFDIYEYSMSQVLKGLPDWSISTAQPQSSGVAVQSGTTDSLRKVVTLLLNWSPKQAFLLQKLLVMLQNCVRFLRHNPSVIIQVLGKLFEAMRFGISTDESMNNNDDFENDLSVQVKRIACSCCISLARELSDVLIHIFPDLVLKVKEQRELGDLKWFQYCSLDEMLIIVCNSLPDNNTRRSLVADICASSVNSFNDSNTTSILASPQGLLHAFGIDSSSGSTDSGAIRNALDNFRSLRMVTFGLSLAAKNTESNKEAELQLNAALYLQKQALNVDAMNMANPFLPMWAQILPNLLNFIRTIHTIWAPEIRNMLLAHNTARCVFSITNVEISHLAKVVGVKGYSPTVVRNDLKYQWSDWLYLLRLELYAFFSTACRHRAIYLVQDPAEYILDKVEYQGNQVTEKYLKGIAEPYILNCPPDLFQSHLLRYAAPLFVHLLRRFSVAWAGAGDIPGVNASYSDIEFVRIYGGDGYVLNIEGEELADDKKEILVDQYRQSSTKASLVLILAILGSNLQHEVSLDEPLAANILKEKAKLLSEFILLGSDEIAYPMVMLIAGALCWPDTSIHSKAIQCAVRITELTWNIPKFIPILGKTFFGAVVHFLLTEPKWISGLEWQMLSLLQMIYTKLVLGGETSDVAANNHVRVCMSNEPRKLILSLPGITEASVNDMEKALVSGSTVKDKKNAFRDLFRNASKHFQEHITTTERMSTEESVLRPIQHAIMDFPETIQRTAHKLVGRESRTDLRDVLELSSLFGDS